MRRRRRRSRARARLVAALGGALSLALMYVGLVTFRPDSGDTTAPVARPKTSTVAGQKLYEQVTQRMVAARTARFVFSGTGGGEVMAGKGSMRFEQHAYDAAIELMMPETGEVKAVLVPAASYLALPKAKGLPKSRPWVKVPPSPQSPVGRQLQPVVEQLRATFDPEQCLGLLRAAKRVYELGPAVVENEPTIHYRAEVDLRRATRAAEGPIRDQYQSMLDAGATTLEHEVWIDMTGLPRRYTTRLPTSEGLFSVTGVYRSWGADVSIDAPEAKQVFDADKLPSGGEQPARSGGGERAKPGGDRSRDGGTPQGPDESPSGRRGSSEEGGSS